MLQELLKKVAAGDTLTAEESFAMTEGIAAGETPAAAAGLLAALAIRGETVAELTGCTRCLRERMTAVPVRGKCADIVGTGGDGGRSFNISTASALVAAGAGVRIAKHGNRAVSGKCGAADVLEELGVSLERSPEELARAVDANGIAFLFARSLHPVMAKVAPLRRELGIRTIFNLVGPLANPARASAMVVGVCYEKLLRPFAEVLRNLGVERAMIVHSGDGLDEISSLAPTRCVTLEKDGAIAEMTIEPADLLRDPSLRTGTLAGGDRAENSRILQAILAGRDRSAKRGAVLLNAAALCTVAGMGASLAESLALAEKSIDSGAALGKLKEMCE